MILMTDTIDKKKIGNRKQVEIKNGFEMHNRKHVSVSQINKFREAPDAWLAQYLMGKRFPYGFAAMQGLAVESGIEQGLFNGIVDDDCVRFALERFKADTTLMSGAVEELEKREPIMRQMVYNGLEQLRELGRPDEPPVGSKQHSIGIPIRFAEGENGTVNCIGYLDFYYPQHDNLVIDLKTTSKAPSSWSLSHGIQAAIYKKAVEAMTQKPCTVKFLYVLTRKKDPYVWLEMTEPDYYIDTFKRTVKQLEAMLRVSSDPKDLVKIIPHNPDSFYWGNAHDIAADVYRDI